MPANEIITASVPRPHHADLHGHEEPGGRRTCDRSQDCDKLRTRSVENVIISATICRGARAFEPSNVIREGRSRHAPR
jgi:hypothetical protein